MLKSCNVLLFYIFTTAQTLACCQDWNNIGVNAMVAGSKPRLATNIIFTTVFVPLLSINYWFLRFQLRYFISAI